MKNVFKVFGIAVLALIGCFMAGCDNGTTSPNTGPAPLKFTGEQVYESADDAITGEMGDTTKQLDYFGFDSKDTISDYFTGSVALTGGKFTVNLTPILSALEDFNANYGGGKNICPADVKGLLFYNFHNTEDVHLFLMKEEADELTHVVYFIYVDRDTTFSGDFAAFGEVKKGWNYLSANMGTNAIERITDLSGYVWVNWQP